MDLKITGGKALRGTLDVPADKSITHRALIFAALGEGNSRVIASNPGEDNHSTARVLAALGAGMRATPDGWDVSGVGLKGLVPSTEALDCGNSGSTIRMVSGVLAGAGVPARLFGDASLSVRPMGRVLAPLRAMGASASGVDTHGKELPPVEIQRGAFAGGAAKLTIASAQVKSALLLAGMCAQKSVEVVEPSLSRDHTEHMMRALGLRVVSENKASGARAVFSPTGGYQGRDFFVPGDISSAAFLLAAGLIVPGSAIDVRGVGINPTRTGFLDMMAEMSATITRTDVRSNVGEPTATLGARGFSGSRSSPVTVAGNIIPRLIDELVVFGAVATQYAGITEVRDAAELRVKESDRIKKTVELLNAFGGRAEERPDGFVVQGGTALRAADIDVSADHRLALTGAILALAAQGESRLRGFDVASVSFPSFIATLQALGAAVEIIA